MAAYIIVDVEITDPVEYAAYIRVVPKTIARYGGRFLVRGGKAVTLEGSWNPKRVVGVGGVPRPKDPAPERLGHRHDPGRRRLTGTPGRS